VAENAASTHVDARSKGSHDTITKSHKPVSITHSLIYPMLIGLRGMSNYVRSVLSVLMSRHLCPRRIVTSRYCIHPSIQKTYPMSEDLDPMTPRGVLAVMYAHQRKGTLPNTRPSGGSRGCNWTLNESDLKSVHSRPAMMLPDSTLMTTTLEVILLLTWRGMVRPDSVALMGDRKRQDTNLQVHVPTQALQNYCAPGGVAKSFHGQLSLADVIAKVPSCIQGHGGQKIG
jgi:hypothetical protein